MEAARTYIKGWKYGTWAYLGLAAAWVFYAWITLAAPIPQQNIGEISFLTLELLRLTVIVPVLLIWLVAMRGAARFKGYAQAIRESKDGRAMNLVASGLLVLVLYMVLLSVLGGVMRLAANTAYFEAVVSVRNHLPVATVVLALGLIYLGSERLNHLTGSHTWTRRSVLGVFLPFCVFAAVFSWTFYTYFTPVDVNGVRAFVFSKEALMFTYVLPHLIAWLLGVLAVINIARYSLKSNGTIYRQALRNLSVGILGVLGSLIVVQIFGIAAAALTRLPLGYLALLVYALLILCAIGFMLIHRGAKNLERLETADE